MPACCSLSPGLPRMLTKGPERHRHHAHTPQTPVTPRTCALTCAACVRRSGHTDTHASTPGELCSPHWCIDRLTRQLPSVETKVLAPTPSGQALGRPASSACSCRLRPQNSHAVLYAGLHKFHAQHACRLDSVDRHDEYIQAMNNSSSWCAADPQEAVKGCARLLATA